MFSVAITLGENKPSNLNFMLDSINEIKNMITDGFTYNNNLIYLDLTAIICDAPAKSFLKQTLQFNGKHGCDRCKQIGIRVHLENEKNARITYPSINIVRLTDEEIKLTLYTILVIPL